MTDLDSSLFTDTIDKDRPCTWPAFEPGKGILPYILHPISLVLTSYVFIKKIICKKIFGRLPKINSIFFDGACEYLSNNKDINAPMLAKLSAGSDRSMELVYKYRFRRPTKKWNDWLAARVSDFWQDMRNCRALRNRLKIARQILHQSVAQFDKNSEIRVISLACGSAEAVLEVIARYKKAGVLVKVILIDLDPASLEKAENNAKKLGVSDQVQIVRDNALHAKIFADFKPHIIEMFGLMEYLGDQSANCIFKDVHEILEEKGIFLTSCISPNMEEWFVKVVINWTMIYRAKEDLATLAEKAGFTKCEVYVEPVGVHNVIKVTK